ncbi:MAG: DUF4150 domain-containing protein [Polyangiaceae bacterium]|nr:DUF4150 domain-containing protein [Polyangiaceae bacterium]
MGSVTALMMDVITEKSGHSMTGLAVSVCLTPAAPSPLPIPYPTFASVSEGVIDECLRTKIDGAKVLTVGSCTKNCHGNEPGTLKEVVSLNTTGPSFPILGAPIVFIELGMAGITLSPGFMNKNPIPGIGGSASGAGGGGSGAGGAGGGGGGPPGGNSKGPSNGGGGGGGNNSGAAPPSPPASPTAEGQASGGHPVDVVTGTMFTNPALDFVLSGLFYIQWDRTYRSSSAAKNIGLGYGWSHSLYFEAERHGGWLFITDDELRTTRIQMPNKEEIVPLLFGRNVVAYEEGIGIDLDDGLLRVLLPDEERRFYRLAMLRDGDGNVATVEWEGGEISAIIDTCGRRVLLERDGAVKRYAAHVTDSEGKEHKKILVSYELNSQGDLIRVIDRGGVEWRYEYDNDHYLVREIRPDGVHYVFRYEIVNGKKLCVETWGEFPGRDILAAISAPEAGTSAAPRGIHHTRFEFGPDPFETKMTDAAGKTHHYVTNPMGQVQRYTDPRGYVSTYSYDDNGRLLSSTDGAGRSRRRTYDPLGRLVTFAFADGTTRRRRYDDEKHEWTTFHTNGAREVERHGEPGTIQTVDEVGRVTTAKMDGAGLIKEVLHPTGAVETFDYDAHGNLSRHTDESGITFEYTWDLWGLPVRVKAQSGLTYELKYDSRHEIAEIVEENGRRTTIVTDAMRNVVEERSTDGDTTLCTYVAGVLTEKIRPDGGRFRFGYDALLRLVWIENAAGERYQRSYDPAGYIERETSFAGVTTEYERDGSGQVVGITRGGIHTRFVRDGEGRILSKEMSTGRVERFRYDARGGLTFAETGASTVWYDLDPEGRVVKETQQTSGFRFIAEYKYDPMGRIAEKRYSSGWGAQLNRRAEDGRLTGVSLLEGETAKPALEFKYSDRGGEIERRRLDAPGTIKTERDRTGLPSRVTLLDADGTTVEDRAFEWSRKGPLSQIADQRRGTRRYNLDEMGRPIQVEGFGVREQFEYAPQGTAISKHDPMFATGRDGRPMSTSHCRLSWDALGRLAARHGDRPETTWQYRYDENNQLVEAVRGDGFSVRYLYDALGRRVAMATSDGSSIWFGWDGDSIVEERASNGAIVRRLFHDDGYTPLFESTPAAGWSLVVSDAAALPWLYVAPDLKISSLETSTWGEVIDRRGEPGALRFAGQRADEYTGLYYNRHRYYAPDLHVFATPDPLGILSVLQDIGYVPNVTIFIDPLGLLTIVNGQPGDPVMEDTIRQMKEKYPDAKVINSDKLGKPPSLWQKITGKGPNANMIDPKENHVFVTTHGAPGGAQWKGTPKNWATGDEIGKSLADAGFKNKKGARVDMTVCNSATPGQGGAPSVAQGIANQTGATAWGAKANTPGDPYKSPPVWEGNFKKPRPWYNFWSKSLGKEGSQDYILGGKGKIHAGEMSGIPGNNTVHGGAYVPTGPQPGSPGAGGS